MKIEPTLQDYSPKDSIDGLKIIKYPIYPSEGGDFAEYFRITENSITLGRGDSLVEIDSFKPRQVSRSFTPQGIVKAWHIHAKQQEIWFPVEGRFILGFYDNRKDSPTSGLTQKIYAGSDNQVAVFIPPGVAHGYRNIGNEDCLLTYVTDQYWDGKDEGRLAWDLGDINFSWEIANG